MHHRATINFTLEHVIWDVHLGSQIGIGIGTPISGTYDIPWSGSREEGLLSRELKALVLESVHSNLTPINASRDTRLPLLKR